ncbi:prepilin-type N-terminal cleavage/methylation domain-containing protein [Bacillus sp. RAR_GA_16]|uniref:prepilin-type N-terminal cleavage/methylation domain-containing protein n=1 Tax=Bacillus sp. RAR_GA_16 TaxID=2876774 RepID=UPI001CCC9E8C|nr:prepilin-type N-terminal cleavage/methylation domain-containing protein [Bacillus sp. RAR_GA_16]
MKRFPYYLNSLGYTLIEMMMVLSVLSLLLALIFLHITPTQHASSTRHFLEDIQSESQVYARIGLCERFILSFYHIAK